MTPNQQQEQFDQAWQQQDVPGDVVVEQAKQIAEQALANEQKEEDFKAGWSEG